MSIQFKRGTFIELEATTTIHLGRLERNLSAGDVIEFDGSSLRIGGEEVSMPELKAGLKRGWLKIPDQGGAPAKAPVKAAKEAVQERTSMKVETVYDEETKVSSIKEESAPVETEGVKFPVVVSTEDEANYLVGTVTNTSGADISGASSAEDGLAEAQGATSVNLTLKTAASQKTIIKDVNSVGQEIDELENLEANFSGEVVKSDEDSSFLTEVVEESEIVEEAPVEEEAPSEDAQILEGLEQSPEQGAVEVGEDDSKIKILSSGVEWDLKPHWTKRVKKALELYSDNPEVLDEIKAVESAGVVNGIDKGLEEDA